MYGCIYPQSKFQAQLLFFSFFLFYFCVCVWKSCSMFILTPYSHSGGEMVKVVKGRFSRRCTNLFWSCMPDLWGCSLLDFLLLVVRCCTHLCSGVGGDLCFEGKAGQQVAFQMSDPGPPITPWPPFSQGHDNGKKTYCLLSLYTFI